MIAKSVSLPVKLKHGTKWMIQEFTKLFTNIQILPCWIIHVIYLRLPPYLFSDGVCELHLRFRVSTLSHLNWTKVGIIILLLPRFPLICIRHWFPGHIKVKQLRRWVMNNYVSAASISKIIEPFNYYWNVTYTTIKWGEIDLKTSGFWLSLFWKGI